VTEETQHWSRTMTIIGREQFQNNLTASPA